ncbi:helix-turn-helix domain-containing protein [Planctomyces sp. SH-PL14]|uniref:helix-turn-helix domain-containing protein n=1 Tax=Planctomyces sp. SH-PL14 TaxID=1632864 RepID=UPI00078C0A06|nr:helix-turn-helix domain-containing protein [Planctomyces sp. SH-PL14]AMV16622.1 Helix-turn-helix domain protein [Planctomyces sp. SH-PL14]
MPAKHFEMPRALKPFWVTLQEAKELLGVSHTTVYQLARDKQIIRDKYSGRAIFGRKSIERYLGAWILDQQRLVALGRRAA